MDSPPPSPPGRSGPSRRSLAGAAEALLEIGGSALVTLGLLEALLRVPSLARRLLALPDGFAARDTPAFLLALALGLAAGPLLMRRLLGGWSPRDLWGRGLGTRRHRLAAGLAAGAVLTLYSRLLLWLAPEILLPAWRDLGLSRAGELWAAILYVTPLAAALPEEIFFRGYAQGTLASRLGRPWALLLAALLFCMAHAGQGLAAVGLAILPAALVLGLLYQHTGSLLAPLVAHVVVNTLTFLQYGLPEIAPRWSGAVTAAVLLLCALCLLLNRGLLPAGWRAAGELARGLSGDGRGMMLSAACLPAAALAVLLAGALAAPLGGGDPEAAMPVVVAGVLLWAGAAVLHRGRGAPWGTDRSSGDAPQTPPQARGPD